MLKNILKLDGAQKLSKNEQKEINGGTAIWCGGCICKEGYPSIYACGINKASACFSACLELS